MKHFVITIARGYGSGGRAIGELLAKELGISLYDRQLLRLAADESGINEALFANADEKIKNNLLLSVAKNIYKGQIIPPDRDDFISNENLFNYQAIIIKQLAEQESCVIIGRCADFILKDMENVIRIYIHAPLADCIKTVEEMKVCPKKNVKNYIQTIDKRRAAYYRYFTGHDWNDASNYDLCINSSYFTRQQCVDLIKACIDIKCANK